MAECLFIKADEVVKMLGVSQSEAYRIHNDFRKNVIISLQVYRIIIF